MLPILFNVGNFPIHAYGFLIAAGFLLCVWQSKREGIRLGMPGERIVDIGFWSLLIGMVGSRILYIITRWDFFMSRPIEMLYVWEGGLVFFGGPLLCIPFFFWYTKRYNIDRWQLLDIAAQAVPLAHAFGRLGCLSAGCCFGKPTGGEWGIKFHTELVDQHLHDVYLHPTQLYEAVALFGLWAYLRRKRFNKAFNGQLLCLYWIIYSVIRSIIEVFRGDTVRGFVIDGILSTSQFISIFTVLGAMILYSWLKKKNTCKPTPTSA